MLDLPHRARGWTYRCYPGLLGAGLLFAWAVSRLGKWLAGGILALLALGTLGENLLWTRPADLLCRDVRHAFHDPAMWRGVAEGYLNRGRPEEGLGLLGQALESPWHTAKLRENAVRALLARSKTPQAHGL